MLFNNAGLSICEEFMYVYAFEFFAERQAERR